MADLNTLVKEDIAKGKSQTEIVAGLSRFGYPEETINSIYEMQVHPSAAVPTGITPTITQSFHQGKGERPILITIVCAVLSVILILGIVRNVLLLSLFLISPAAILLLVPGFLLQLLSFAVIYGYWMMRRWAVYLYCAMFFISIILSAGSIAQNPQSLLSIATLVAMTTIGLGFYYIGEMS